MLGAVLLPVQVDVVGALWFQPVHQHLVVEFIEAEFTVAVIVSVVIQVVAVAHQCAEFQRWIASEQVDKGPVC